MGSCLGCLACEALSCCGSMACTGCSKAAGATGASKAGRAIYVAIFAITAFLAFIGGTWAPQLLSWVPVLDLCSKFDCMGELVVYRMTFGLALFHIFMSLLMIGVRDSSDWRFSLQNEWWIVKVLVLVALIVIGFVIPTGFFAAWGWICMIGAALYIIVQLVLLVDFAHRWSEKWARNMEETEDNFWFYSLLTITLLLFAAALAGSIVIYVKFCHDCGKNVMFVTINLAAAVIYTGLSIHPSIQEANGYRSGLLQAAVVAAFTTYNIFSAVISEPPSWGSCNPWAVTSDGDHMTSASTITSKALGALICVVAVCYSAFNAASNSGALLGNDETPEEKKADEAGTPLVPNLESEAEDTTETVSYSFSLFHLAFALGAMYVAMLLTSWQVVDVDQNDKTGFADSGTVSAWVKVITSWLTILLYVWTVVAPIMLPGRDWN